MSERAVAGSKALAWIGLPKLLRYFRSRKKGPIAQSWGLAFVLPILVLFVAFKFWPILRAVWLSLFEASPLERSSEFVGLGNYSTLWRDSLFLKSLRATAYYVVGTVVPLVLLSLLLALMLNQKIRGRGFFRTVLFLPALIPVIVVPILWRFLFHPFGLVNSGITGLGFDAVNWLQSTSAVIPGFIIASEWRFVPLFMIIYLAGLQTIPEALYDAAKVDGATAFQRFKSVTLPILKPTIAVVVVISVTLTAKSLVLALVMTNGGPDGASRLLSLFIYEQGFRFFRTGYASAVSMVLLGIVMVVTLINLRIFRTDED